MNCGSSCSGIHDRSCSARLTEKWLTAWLRLGRQNSVVRVNLSPLSNPRRQSVTTAWMDHSDAGLPGRLPLRGTVLRTSCPTPEWHPATAAINPAIVHARRLASHSFFSKSRTQDNQAPAMLLRCPPLDHPLTIASGWLLNSFD